MIKFTIYLHAQPHIGAPELFKVWCSGIVWGIVWTDTQNGSNWYLKQFPNHTTNGPKWHCNSPTWWPAQSPRIWDRRATSPLAWRSSEDRSMLLNACKLQYIINISSSLEGLWGPLDVADCVEFTIYYQYALFLGGARRMTRCRSMRGDYNIQYFVFLGRGPSIARCRWMRGNYNILSIFPLPCRSSEDRSLALNAWSLHEIINIFSSLEELRGSLPHALLFLIPLGRFTRFCKGGPSPKHVFS